MSSGAAGGARFSPFFTGAKLMRSADAPCRCLALAGFSVTFRAFFSCVRCPICRNVYGLGVVSGLAEVVGDELHLFGGEPLGVLVVALGEQGGIEVAGLMNHLHEVGHGRTFGPGVGEVA